MININPAVPVVSSNVTGLNATMQRQGKSKVPK